MLQRARRGGIRPISIGRALLAHLDTQFDDLGNSGALAPKYIITLHPEDATELRAFEATLLEELRHAVSHHATIEGYTLSGDVEIRIETDPTVKRGTCKVVPIVHSTPMPMQRVDPSGTNGALTNATVLVTDAAIVLGNGERITLDVDLAIVGRQSDCHIVIDDHNVSRTHAEIRRTANGWVITDRGSTNGTMVNGQKVVTSRLLANGDTIAFGSAPVRFENS